MVWREQSTPFGEMLAANDGQQPLRFPGQYSDLETGYSYNYFRDYDPSLGRYIQSDPIGLAGGVNTFGYVSANPIVMVDPFGLEAYVPGDWRKGGINSSDGTVPAIWGADYRNLYTGQDGIVIGFNSLPPRSVDADMFKMNLSDEFWTKIQFGDVSVSSSGVESAEVLSLHYELDGGQMEKIMKFIRNGDGPELLQQEYEKIIRKNQRSNHILLDNGKACEYISGEFITQ